MSLVVERKSGWVANDKTGVSDGDEKNTFKDGTGGRTVGEMIAINDGCFGMATKQNHKGYRR